MFRPVFRWSVHTMMVFLFLAPSYAKGSSRDFITNGDFEGEFTEDEQGDFIPNGWTKFETSDPPEDSTITRGDSNGPSLAGQFSLFWSRPNGAASGDWSAVEQSGFLIDASRYSELKLSLDTLVISHSLEGGGCCAFEWPAIVQISYTRAGDHTSTAAWRHGWYVDPPGDGRIVNDQFDDTKVTPDIWQSNVFNLLDEIDDLGQITSIIIGGSGWSYEGKVDNVQLQGVPILQAGDADQDLDFDALDFVRVLGAAKYRTGQEAAWGEGDWNGAPGGSPGSPPAGDGFFDQVDIIAALSTGLFLTGQYAGIKSSGGRGHGPTAIRYDANTGEVAVDTPAGVELTSLLIESAAGIFTGNRAENLNGSFDIDVANSIFKATIGSSFGSISFGKVAQAGLEEDVLMHDLNIIGSYAGGGKLGHVDLIYVAVPEPSTFVLMFAGLCGVICLTMRNVGSAPASQPCRNRRPKVSDTGN